MPLTEAPTQPLRILMPVDFSAHDEVGFRFVQRMARRGPVQLTLLHILQVPTLPSYELGAVDLAATLVQQLEAQANEHLQTMAQHPALQGLQAQQVLHTELLHSPGTQVAHHAAEHQFDMVLTLSKHRTAVQSFLAGTELLRIIRTATTPVLVLSPDKVPAITRILFATDFSADAVPIFLHLLRFAQFFDAGIYMAKINTRASYETTRDFRLHCRDFNELLATNALDAMGMVTDYINYHDEDIVSGIINCAEDHLADMVVLATRGLTGLSRMINGSVTEEVIESTDLPLLVYKLGSLPAPAA